MQTQPLHLTALAAAGVLLFAAGCSYVKTPVVAFSDDGSYLQQGAGSGLVVDPNSHIPDVPNPIGFKAVASKSSWRYDGRVRVVHYVYQGHAKQGEALEFYRAYLPENHWSLVDIQTVGETTVLRYVKGPEALSIETSRSWGVSTITIDITGR